MVFYVIVYNQENGEEVHRVGPIDYLSKAEKVEFEIPVFQGGNNELD